MTTYNLGQLEFPHRVQLAFGFLATPFVDHLIKLIN